MKARPWNRAPSSRSWAEGGVAPAPPPDRGLAARAGRGDGPGPRAAGPRFAASGAHALRRVSKAGGHRPGAAARLPPRGGDRGPPGGRRGSGRPAVSRGAEGPGAAQPRPPAVRTDRPLPRAPGEAQDLHPRLPGRGRQHPPGAAESAGGRGAERQHRPLDHPRRRAGPGPRPRSPGARPSRFRRAPDRTQPARAPGKLSSAPAP